MITKWIQFTVAEWDVPAVGSGLRQMEEASTLEEGCTH